MSAECVFEQSGERFVCSMCGRSVTTKSGTAPRAVCRGPRGLGDMVADGLSAVGITKKRVQAVASAVGVKDCGCRGRQHKMNELGHKYLGLPAGRADAPESRQPDPETPLTP